ncbi:hypothetical protein SPRG_07757 [Saprolegnia parasitica CBS 223.65]|uniref:Uncharacterized protein n=1 Tax=Saprolegnia parasitica (strain CBS 223.65) TaxID=695850 RepID=A0A067CKF6_SAPPC|nr:hypothetical protein SPRG_07757 [Saprolegnia parasitica CBS 223.65]KDO27046.1 hypothetical protein SPRG_07757 [Saprolegnia parasitica CBS 223.65]|eukprot:XP_012202141.1 hypothetical protein SPRG_07757 [Saprolegnia parasitica CBS 223.65]
MPTDDESKALQEDGLGDADLKIILLGDSAVGKSKLVERFMMNEYQPRQLSTFALTLFRKELAMDDGTTTKIDIWDTAGQERFSSMHPSYYFGASACILVFDVTRKTTYQHLADWYKELREYCENIPCFLAANKIDVDLEVTNKSSSLPRRTTSAFTLCRLPTARTSSRSLKKPSTRALSTRKRVATLWPTSWICSTSRLASKRDKLPAPMLLASVQYLLLHALNTRGVAIALGVTAE